MANECVLVVDDERSILELVRYNLAQRGYRVVLAETGESALSLGGSELPDLIILDLMLPGIDGLDVCRRLKADPRTKDIPILMLSARGEEEDVALGMEMGADDYILKPFSPKVLMARVRAALRRKQDTTDEFATMRRVGTMVVNPVRRELVVDGDPVHLSDDEFAVIDLLTRSPARVHSRREIAEVVAHANGTAELPDPDLCVKRLRAKLGDAGKHIEKVRSVGYRLSNY